MKTQTDAGPVFLTAEDFKKMIGGACRLLEKEKETINAINVFPVPDGDTGTNLRATLKEVEEVCFGYKGDSLGELSGLVASRALLGARGNSGVIFSQLLRGIARGLQGKKNASARELSKALWYSVVFAYRAVSNPVEGTILSVGREAARGASKAARGGADIHGLLEEAISSGKEMLALTTDMIPALKEAGVVDAGGMGLIIFMEGCLYSLRNDVGDFWEPVGRDFETGHEPFLARQKQAACFNLENIYCSELVIKGAGGRDKELRRILEQQGEYLLLVNQGGIIKVHIHTGEPGRVISTCLQYGTLHDLKIENMQEQHSHLSTSAGKQEGWQPLPPKNGQANKTGIIVIAPGDGLKKIFLSLGADEVVPGGQSMNPRVEDVLEATLKVPYRQVIILPNNKNVQPVARQVQELCEKEVTVLGAFTVPQGLAALLAFKPTAQMTDNKIAMERAAGGVKTGEVTFATRSATVADTVIKQGDYLGLFDGNICSWGKDLNGVAFDLAQKMRGEDDEIITLLQGRDTPYEDAASLMSLIKEAFPLLEVELKQGGQPLYYYIISVE